MSDVAAGERVLFEARVSPHQLALLRRSGLLFLWFPLFGLLHADSWTKVALLGISTLALAFGLLVPARREPRAMLQVTDRALRAHFGRSASLKAPNIRTAQRMLMGVELEEISIDELRGIAWENESGLGIQLADGSVTPVLFALVPWMAPAENSDSMRAAVRAFVERATGRALPPTPDLPLDAAPWTVRKKPRPSS